MIYYGANEMESNMSSIYDFDVNILQIADDFLDAYYRCREGKNPDEDEHGRIVIAVPHIPAIVNAAFACELYFKSMIAETETGHKLQVLFNKLSDDNKNAIRERTEEALLLLNLAKDFDGYIEVIDDVFISWRYIHEKSQTQGFLGNQINMCVQVFKILIPAIKEVAHIQNS